MKRRRFIYSLALTAVCLGFAALQGVYLLQHGWVWNDWALIALGLLVMAAFGISYTWFTVRYSSNAARANRIIVLPIAIVIAVLLVGLAGYVLYSSISLE